MDKFKNELFFNKQAEMSKLKKEMQKIKIEINLNQDLIFKQNLLIDNCINEEITVIKKLKTTQQEVENARKFLEKIKYEYKDIENEIKQEEQKIQSEQNKPSTSGHKQFSL